MGCVSMSSIFYGNQDGLIFSQVSHFRTHIFPELVLSERRGCLLVLGFGREPVQCNVITHPLNSLAW